ncbi:MAG TPA: helicase-exonuclease AddAB subunit AddA, partial [Clostridiales bacterium]|nr:helicase-exonuclease AddAB subunit AddA [Clostridiales bacterium]
MAEARWTPEQLDAITRRDCNLLVAAAAGAGKTAVLVERIIRKITTGDRLVDIDRLLVMTFTNAAAAEMRERIAKAITQARDRYPESMWLMRQLTLLGKASITTIHSFCLDVVRSNFHLIHIDPAFRIADETESQLMKLEALDEVFEEQYDVEPEMPADAAATREPEMPADAASVADVPRGIDGFLDLLEHYGGNRDDQVLKDLVLRIYDFIQSNPWPEAWLRNMTDRFLLPGDQAFEDTPWGQVLLGAVSLELEGLCAMTARAIRMMASADGFSNYLSVFREDLANLQSLQVLLEGTDPALNSAPDPALNSAPELGPEHGQEPALNSAPEPAPEPVSGPALSRWDRLFTAIAAFTFSRLGRCAREADETVRDAVKEIRDAVKDGVKKIRECHLYAVSEQLLEDLQSLHPRMQGLCGLVLQLSARYAEKKSRKAVLDFNDLEHFCLDILAEKTSDGKFRPSPAALSYRQRFEEILVDEYQDSNLVQEMIIRMVSREEEGRHNVFMVGDVKQSIYRFRQARPQLFLEKYLTYGSEPGGLCSKILLYRNFRSRRNVLEAINFLFKQIMSVPVGELRYTDEEALNPGADYPNPDEAASQLHSGGPVELHLLDCGGSSDEAGDLEDGIPADRHPEGEEAEEFTETEDTEDSSEDEILDNIQTEARLTGRLILQLLHPAPDGNRFQVLDKTSGTYRDAGFRDIVVLLRTTKNWAGVYAEEMAAMEIPAFADSDTGFFKTVEVQVMLSLLQILDNPLQDIPLLAVLRSPIAGFTNDDLAAVRLADRKAPFYKALKIFAASASGSLAQKAGAFLKKLKQWMDLSLYQPVDQLLWQLYQETGYYSMAGAMPLGGQRQANLRFLFEQACKFEASSYKGLFHFVNFIDKLKGGRGDLGSAKILSENDDVVRIMSIHKSKGLEFPVVILSGCGKGFNFQDTTANILLHEDLGFGPDVVDPALRLSWPSAAKRAIRVKIRAETLSEEMRILYVALTRAREKLILTGVVKNMARTAGRWVLTAADAPGFPLPVHALAKARCYLDWIGPSLIRHPQCTDLARKGTAGNLDFHDGDIASLSDPS